MIIIPERQACFVHIPRTGGMALQTALCRCFRPAKRFTHGWEHASAHAVRRVLPSPDYRIFTVIRNPWAIFQSHWGWLQIAKTIPDLDVSEGIRHGLSIEAQMTFPEIVRHWIALNILASDGGFAARYCDAKTIVFRYEDEPWPAIAELLDCDLMMERENESRCEPPEWDEATIDSIAHYCRGDVERFQYQSPTP